MNEAVDNQRVLMVRDNLQEIPDCPLPNGFTFRWYLPGDEPAWLRIQQAADVYNHFTQHTFAAEFGPDLSVLAERQCYLLEPGGRAVGTVTAWHNDRMEGEGYARLHWMAVTPDCQGLGLGKALMSVICQQMRTLGYQRAYLSTGVARLPAIGLYLSFGFVPLIRNEQDAARWAGVSDTLRLPRLKSAL